ncbi:mechanosensitive ion channel [Treponema parvum]|uniref:Mechanosensitive ion channel n=1 Tax=Treponema parvum TaxID=138851 RepID=A0A975F0A5_9SPIR|nr:mechanosensitive ion channel domain-containing protein [Treponema parvum]QTQ12139.1 mechanosensitive ion channel [Treponema parvum]QTQ15871.1 mechanosensitive ion channel [Treponema parvum]
MNKLTTSIETLLSSISGIKIELTSEKLVGILQFIGTLALIYIFFKILKALSKKFLFKKMSMQTQHIIKKAIDYSAFVTIVLTVFHRLGIDVSGLLGAAGIAGIAIGFAAQTSVSNVISGLFVITERAFKIGDTIEIADIIGTVQSINLLSVALKTFDSQYVRVPSETIIKANLINYSHFPFRRVKTELSVSYDTDLRRVETILIDTAKKNRFIVDDPAPSVLWTAFASSGISCALLAWTSVQDYGSARNSIFIDIDERLKKEGIEIPFDQLVVHTENGSEKTAGKKS